MSSLLALEITHEGRRCEICKVPESFREGGCVVLVDHKQLIELEPRTIRSCGIFELQLIEVEANVISEAHAGSADTTSALDVTIHGTEFDSQTIDPASDLETRDLSIGTNVEVQRAGVSNGISDIPRVSVEIYPRIDGYRLLSLLGRGGMGTVWKATQLSTNRTVALKTILPWMLNRPNARIRFKREVELAASLNHPGLATIYASGETQGHHYYSMELVDGVAWGKYVRDRDPSTDTILNQFRRVLDAVEHAHNHDVIHRDLKPSNILIHQDGSVRVVDFGLAKQRSRTNEDLSKQGDVLGTLAFMAPEQASGKVGELDLRVDIYSLGVVALSFVTRHMVVESDSADPVSATALMDRRASSPSKTTPSSPAVLPYFPELRRRMDRLRAGNPKLAKVLERAVAVDADKRYSNCQQFKAAIDAHLDATKTATNAQREPIGKDRRQWIIASLGLAVGGIGFWAWDNRRRGERSTPNRLLSDESLGEKDRSQENEQRLLELERENSIRAKFATDFDDTTSLTDALFATRSLGNKKFPTDCIVHPERWPLCGFRFCVYSYRNDDIIKVMQPIFRHPATEDQQTGPMIGQIDVPCEFVEEIGKPGYFVGAVQVRWGSRVHGIRFRYDRLKDGQLVASDSYFSDWYGGREGMKGQLIESNGKPVAGIHFASDADVDCIALVMPRY